MAENLLNRRQEEINKEFGVNEIGEELCPEWRLFTYKGKGYAEWQSPPRFFVIQEEGEKERWEALRKYLVRVKGFLGGDILMSNDVCWYGLPREDEKDGERAGYYLPGKVWEEELAPPDYKKYPKLKKIKELEGLTW